MQKNGSSKRVAIYATYDSKGTIDDYILYCLNEMKTVSDDIVVVSNNKLSQQSKSKLSMATKIIERDDTGFDVGGYASGINYVKGLAEFQDYDELIIMNDSVFGPFYPIKQMFEKMDEKPDFDFWGISSRGKSNFDGTDAEYPRHIQLYFYVVRRKMLHSEAFLNYWDNILNRITDFRSAIVQYEFSFTKYFEDRGFTWDIYCPTPQYDTELICNNLSPYHYCSFELISEKKCPFLKRKLFSGEFIDGSYSNKDDAKRAVQYVAKNTSYNVEMMWKHVLRIYPIDMVMHAMQLTEIISDTNCEEFKKNNAISRALIEEEMNLALKEEHFFAYNMGKYTIVVILKCETEQPEALNQTVLRNVKDNLLKNESYICNILNLFESDNLLGLLIPPANYWGDVAYSIENTRPCEAVSKMLDMNDSLCVPTHKINGFVCRNEILTQNLIDELKGNNGLELIRYMPYYAQKMGFYTKVAVNIQGAVSILENGRDAFRNLWRASCVEIEKDCSVNEMVEMIYSKRINTFIDRCESVYIYGAGGLATRVVQNVERRAKIRNVVVSNLEGNEKDLLGIPIIKFDEIIGKQGGVIIAVGKKNSEIIKKKLGENHFNEFIVVE